MRTALPLVILAALAFVGAILFWPDAPELEETASGVGPQAPAAALTHSGESLASEAGGDVLAEVESSAGERRAAPLTPLIAEDSASPAAATAKWGGRVVGDLGQGIAEAEVILSVPRTEDGLALAMNFGTGGGGTRAVTDEQGRFSLPAREAGRYRLRIGADGFAPLDLANVDAEGGEQDLGTFQLEPGLVLGGRVVDEGGAPVAGAAVSADPLRASGWSTFTFGGPEVRPDSQRTDADGRFRLPRLALGSKRLSVMHPEHPRRTFDVELKGAERERQGLELVVPRGGRIAGSLAGYSGNPAQGYRVVAMPLGGPQLTQGVLAAPAESAVSAEGTFELRGLEPAGSYELTAMRVDPELPGIPDDAGALAILGQRREVSERLEAQVGDLGVLLAIRAGAILTFQLVDDATGEPLPRFRARLGRPGSAVELEVPQGGFPEGRAHFEDVYPEADPLGFMPPESLTLSAEGFRDIEVPDVRLELGRTTDLGVLRMQAADQLRVRVTALASGEPIRGATVQVGPAGPSLADAALDTADDGEGTRTMSFTMTRGVDLGDGSEATGEPSFESVAGPSDVKVARTDKDGWAALGLPAGDDLELSVVKRGFAAERRSLSKLPAGEPIEIALGEGGQVIVRVVDEAGAPVPDARVEHRAPRPANGGGRNLVIGGPGRSTNARGEVTFEDLIPGQHRFRLAGGGAPMFDFGDGSSVMIGAPGSDTGSSEWTSAEVDHGVQKVVELLRPTGSVVFGQVRESGAPLVDAHVSLRRKRPGGGGGLAQGMDLSALLGGAAGPNGTTDSEGAYRIEQLEPGDYTLTVKHVTRSLPADFSLTVGSGEQRFDIDLANAAVEGRVVDAAGQPVANARVSAALVDDSGEAAPQFAVRMVTMTGAGGQAMTFGDEGDSVFTDVDGRYRLRGLPPDRDLRVEVQPPSGSLYLSRGESEVFQLEPDEVRTGEEVELPTGGALRARILDAAGEQVPFALVLLRPDGETEPEREIAQNGQFEKGGLAPGVWWVSTQALTPGRPQDPGEERRVVIVQGEALELDLEL